MTAQSIDGSKIVADLRTTVAGEVAAARVELTRVLPVVEALTACGILVSIDTMRAEVARAAVAAGAGRVNDVSGGLADPGMAPCVAELGVPYVAMHWRAHSRHLQEHAAYGDVAIRIAAAWTG